MHRSRPEELSFLGAEFAMKIALTDQLGEDCLPHHTTDAMLGMLLVFYVPGGFAVGLVFGWMMLAIGFAAALATDHVRDLRSTFNEKSTWPWLSPICEESEVLIEGVDPTHDSIRPEWTQGQEAVVRFHNALKSLERIPKEDLRYLAHIAAEQRTPDARVEWGQVDSLLEVCLEKQIAGGDWESSNADIARPRMHSWRTSAGI